ncbi:NADP-dependent oxidoreductase [Methylobacterium sp. 77]|uniref:NADP-dependent oxidoreductase n=1 Tax=Methylobacterium sp. 77 TaxID=1101192 RepID=UPI000379B89E|nr:NADP-dependent oxidoreductase [Methylobacterium sp. 77]
MKAFILDRYKKKQPLRLGEMPEPTIRDGDVLVAIEAAGLNLLDAKIRNGEFKALLKYRPPFVLGHDLAGTVIRIGRNVRRFKVGDAVYARPRDGRIGTFAERIAVDEADLALKPTNLSMAEAASIPLVGLTAWQALVEMAELKPGDKVLIHAGSGGVGTFAIQLAKHLGATVATTTSAANADLVRSLGADIVIDYRRQDFEKILSGYDVVINSLDGETLRKSLNVLKPGGKLISISGPPDPAFAKAQGLNWVLTQIMRLLSLGIRRKAKARGIDYAFLFMRASGAQLAEIATLLEAGTIRPVIDRVVPFEATDRALTELEAGRSKGKVVVELHSEGAAA